MPLPPTDAIAFRGIPSLGDKATIALSLTLTQKQVEAMFARQASINQLASQSATQFPLEIDFDKKKMYIGDAATSFNSGKETGIREICRRTPSSAKPLVGLFLSATVVGKLTIPRGLTDAASDLRKATEAEQTKKSERGIVRIDTPITAANGKKSRASGATSLAKQAIGNRIVSSQSNFSTPRSIGSTSVSKPTSSRPSVTTPVVSGVKEPDFNTLKSRLIHFMAASARAKEVAISEFLSTSRSSVDENEVRKVFDEVAQEIPGPKNSDPTRWLWDLKSESWLEVRPFAFPDYSTDQRTQASRRARISSGVSSLHPVWEHFSTRVDPSALASAKAITAGGIRGGIYPNAKGKKAATKPSIPKGKAPSTSKPIVEGDGDLKPRKILPSTEETKVKTKIESSMTIPSHPNTQPLLKPSKKLEDDAPSKPRVVSTSVKEELSLRPPASADNSLRKRKLTDMEPEPEPTSDMEEGELPSKEPKKRRVIGPPEVSKPEPTKKFETPTIIKRALPAEKIPNLSPPKQGRDSQGTKVAAGGSSSRVSVGKAIKQEPEVKQRKEREPKLDKARIRDGEREKERERNKGKEKTREKEEGREREKRPTERDSGREKGKRIRDRVNEEEAVERFKSEKLSAPIKRKRRATPSFSSDEGSPPPSKRVTTAPVSRPSVTSTTSSTVKSNPSKVPKPALGPATLPTDKEGLRREYGVYYAQYLLLTSKFYDQKSKIENVLALDTDGASADEGSDIMDSKELTELCEEYHRIRNELERIRKAQGSLNTNAY